MPGIDVECGAPVLVLLLSKALSTGLGGEASTPFLSPFLLVSLFLFREKSASFRMRNFANFSTSLSLSSPDLFPEERMFS